MILVHTPNHDGVPLVQRALEADEAIPDDAVWIDLHQPTRDEDVKVEAFLKISIPTRDDMLDIEPSELLWVEDEARYMTARLLYQGETDDPSIIGITFILKGKTLVTVRYAEPRAFSIFSQKSARPGGCTPTPEGVLAGLIDTIIDRAADILQGTGERIDALSRLIFDDKDNAATRSKEYTTIFKALGRFGDLISKQRESLVSIERILLFLSASYRNARVPLELREEVRSTLRDLQSLEEHASFLSGKVQFLLDASLGLVNLEQNNIIKLFSVMAVVFMPPTLIASIYGMNFKTMPELSWEFGYPMALGLMIIAAILPYAFFRWKKWL